MVSNGRLLGPLAEAFDVLDTEAAIQVASGRNPLLTKARLLRAARAIQEALEGEIRTFEAMAMSACDTEVGEVAWEADVTIGSVSLSQVGEYTDQTILVEDFQLGPLQCFGTKEPDECSFLWTQAWNDACVIERQRFGMSVKGESRASYWKESGISSLSESPKEAYAKGVAGRSAVDRAGVLDISHVRIDARPFEESTAIEASGAGFPPLLLSSLCSASAAGCQRVGGPSGLSGALPTWARDEKGSLAVCPVTTCGYGGGYGGQRGDMEDAAESPSPMCSRGESAESECSDSDTSSHGGFEANRRPKAGLGPRGALHREATDSLRSLATQLTVAWSVRVVPIARAAELLQVVPLQ